jgi:hypothetical protein
MSGERIGNSNQFLSISGVVSAPAYSWASDNNTGIYHIGANNIGVAADGAKVLDIATTGLSVTGALTASGTTTSAKFITGTFSVNGGSTTTSGVWYNITLPAGAGYFIITANNNQNGYSGYCQYAVDGSLNQFIVLQAKNNVSGCVFQVSGGNLQVQQNVNNVAILAVSYTFFNA